MSDNNKPYKGLDEANQHIEALKELHLPFLPIDAKMSINLALKRCEEVLEPFNERAQALKEEEDPDNQLILLKQKKHWDDLRVQINKLLGIVIAK